MKIIIVYLLLIFMFLIQANSQKCIDKDFIMVSHNEVFSCIFESFIRGKAISSTKNDIIIFSKEYEYFKENIPVAFIFYKYNQREMCDIFFISNCKSVVENYIMLDANINIQLPNEKDIWLKGDEYYPLPNTPIVRCDNEFYAVIHYNQCFRNYFDFDPFEKHIKDFKIYEKRKLYIEKIKGITDEIWDAYINNKFKTDTYKDRKILYIERN